MRVKMSKQPPPAPTVSAVGPCPTVIQIVGRPGTGLHLASLNLITTTLNQSTLPKLPHPHPAAPIWSGSI